MNKLNELFLSNEKYLKILENIKNKKNDISIFGLTDSQKAHIIYALTESSKKSSCIICQNTMQAKKVIQDLKFFSDIEIVYFPAREIVYYDLEAESREIESARMYAIHKLCKKENIILVTTIDAALQRMLPLERYNFESVNIKVSDKVNLDQILNTLVTLGYERSSFVEGKGQFAVRGGIIDIFANNDKYPHRIELFSDEVESIRTFDVLTQRSIENKNEFNLSRVSEYIFDENTIEKAKEKMQNLLNENKISKHLKENIQKDIEHITNLDYSKLVDKYFEILCDDFVCFIDNIKDFCIYVDEPLRCKEKVNSIIYENGETIKMLAEKDYLYIPFANRPIDFESFEAKLKNLNSVYLERINTDTSIHTKRDKYEFSARQMNFYKNSTDILINDIKAKKKNLILLVFPTAVRVEQIKNILLDENIHVTKIDNIFSEKLKLGNVYIMQGILSGGYDFEEFNITVISEQVTGTYNKHKEKEKKNDFGKIINSFEDLKIGDYVVHEDHGIGIYRGVQTVEIEKVVSDYIKIEYAASSCIFVPISQLDSVKKYMCDDMARPKINMLGSKEWIRAKTRAKESIDTIAKDLIQLYAIRDKSEGFAFSKDTPWQKEFEDDFPYELTEDQEYAVKEIKKDMEDIKPMDRLLCGDVGYGKTEVAIRAAFKAVMDSKQVAYLVPTTVLSLQQYNTFKARMEKYGIKVEMLSRFKTKKEQKDIIENLKEGKVDIVIGTHRMLSSDIYFKNLGLLIIDEEHRFGVKAKETLKQLKKNVDVLSMTATPIPRTLNMSIIGVRSMSTLTMPPLERMPVHTYVLEYDENIIKAALERELARDGQVFYINNRVDNIESVAEKVRMLVPDAKVAYAHRTDGCKANRRCNDFFCKS